ncbi:type VII secretion protein EssB [Peribacillus glennii]|nr:type VII secretion protein EssB [Peribacillus glennii]
MEENKTSYLEIQLEADITKDNGYAFIFQRARIKMQDPLELQLLREMDGTLQREIVVTDDEVKISIHPPASFSAFREIRKKNKLERWIFAHQLIKKIENHTLDRLNLVICPENIVFDASFTPYLLHYGVKESIPPYNKDQERLLQETKATISEIVDGQHSFDQYFQYHQTLKLSNPVQEIFAATSMEQLSEVIQSNIQQLEKQEKNFIHIPMSKWKTGRYAFIGAVVLLLPALIYSLYSLLFLQPKQDAYVNSGQNYMENKYSEVINLLENYDPEDMPYVVQYELAYSYMINEDLDDYQRKNIENELTLQSDSQYLLYWIYVGRGMNEEAIDIARSLEHQDLIVFGLIKRVEEIKADENLSGEEKEQELKKAEDEIAEYRREQDEMKEQLEEQQQDANSTTDGQSTGELIENQDKTTENKSQVPASAKQPKDEPEKDGKAEENAKGTE